LVGEVPVPRGPKHRHLFPHLGRADSRAGRRSRCRTRSHGSADRADDRSGVALFPLRGAAAIARRIDRACGSGSRPFDFDRRLDGRAAPPQGNWQPADRCSGVHRCRSAAMAAPRRARRARAALDCARVETGMKDGTGTLLTLALQFSLLSFLAIGGAITALPEMHRQAVDVYHWMTSTQFTQLVAIAQAAPGPNVLIVTLIGQQVAGIPGALVATV